MAQTRDPSVCQICGKKGHVALKCWNRFNQSYQLDDIPQAIATMTLKNFYLDEWIADTGASTHMTGNSYMPKNSPCYVGSDAIIIGICSTHAITHIGDTYINNGTNKIKL